MSDFRVRDLNNVAYTLTLFNYLARVKLFLLFFIFGNVNKLVLKVIFLFSAYNLTNLTVETEDKRSAIASDPIPLPRAFSADTRALSRCKAMGGSFQRGRFQVCVFGCLFIIAL